MNRNNVSIPIRLKKRCYDKGISIYNATTLAPKTMNQLEKECAKNSKTKGNENTIAYGVPPLPERARAIRNALPNKSVSDVIVLAQYPFFSFKNPMYLPKTPLPGNKKTLVYTLGHNVWTILPNYFPGPNKTSKSSPVCRKLPSVEQMKRKKQLNKNRDEKYKKKWSTTLKKYKHTRRTYCS